ncbi:MAG: cytochrome c-type biogenesis protein CcmH [Actinomycetota bacterium]|nr:cytochrome c-type biogenesis protein CcmH [Actinomycetota bacterium]
MRRLAQMTVVVVAALGLACPALATEERPTLADVEGEVMCPVCDTTLDQSDSPAADQVRGIIAERIRAGDTEAEIKAHLVREFGPAILAAPPREGFDLLAWWLPVVAVGAGALALGYLAWRWSRGAGPQAQLVPATENAALALSADVERRLDDELRRFDD